MSSREPFAAYLAKMAAVGFRPSSAMGQNFLLDPSLHRWLAAAAAPAPVDTIVEIGPGLGFLTRELAPRARRVVAVELDARLLAIVRAELADQPHVEFVHGDALGGPGRSAAPEIPAAIEAAHARGGAALLVANLPYAVAGPLLAAVAALPELPERAVLLVQRELAERLAAGAGTTAYGGLSATVQALFRVELLRLVAPEVFRPRPKVWSAVVQLDRRPDPAPELAAAAARREFAVFVRRLFQQRRKALRSVLPAAAAAIGRLAPEPVPPALSSQRAEQLGPAELIQLWASCR
ncbi:MAG: ribosomal RNA small subunit methyltransferase A [Planctomycetes bacterium]|nr:ribosomal RNA small subunit methyltransferase A [Planctomycetota bacterium]